MTEFDEKKYKKKYGNVHYSRFFVDLKIDEKKELDMILKKENMTKAEFLRKSIANFKVELK